MRTILALLLALCGAVSARADYQIGVAYFSANGSVEVYGKGLAQMLDTDLVQQVGSDGKFASCGAVVIEVHHRDEILKELELSKSPYVDPATRLTQGRLLDATYMIEGSVQPDGADGMSWQIQMREVATGRIVARDSASIKLDKLVDASGQIVERLLNQICKSYRLSGNAGPMAVTGTICSLAKPFTTKGGGGGMTIEFTYTPSTTGGGKVSYTGGGGGVKMVGGGTYTVTADEKGGSLTHTHSGRVLAPGGGSATYTETFKLTPIPRC